MEMQNTAAIIRFFFLSCINLIIPGALDTRHTIIFINPNSQPYHLSKIFLCLLIDMLHNCFHSRTKKYGCANLLYQWNSSLSKITPPHYWSFQHSSYIKTNLSIWLLSISLNSQWKQIKIELSGNCTIIMENPQAWKK